MKPTPEKRQVSPNKSHKENSPAIPTGEVFLTDSGLEDEFSEIMVVETADARKELEDVLVIPKKTLYQTMAERRAKSRESVESEGSES